MSRSRANSCKEGLTGKGVVLPPEAAAEVNRREAEFAREFRPRDAIERELVRQLALGAWRSGELAMRIVDHDAGVEGRPVRQLGGGPADRGGGDRPSARRGPRGGRREARRSSAGCDWLIGRWRLLGNGLSTAEEGGPDCTWTDADLALVLDLLGRPKGLRHLDEWPGRLESLRDRGPGGLGRGGGRIAGDGRRAGGRAGRAR